MDTVISIIQNVIRISFLLIVLFLQSCSNSNLARYNPELVDTILSFVSKSDSLYNLKDYPGLATISEETITKRHWDNTPMPAYAYLSNDTVYILLEFGPISTKILCYGDDFSIIESVESNRPRKLSAREHALLDLNKIRPLVNDTLKGKLEINSEFEGNDHTILPFSYSISFIVIIQTKEDYLKDRLPTILL